MNFVGILAGGSGSRMGDTEFPKQFLNIGNKPILIHTVEKFLSCNEIDDIIIAVPQKWYDYTENLIEENIKSNKIKVVVGGNNRNDSLTNICSYIKNNYSVSEEDIIITHDAVRPFFTERVIKDNIQKCKEYGAVNTVVKAIDTIVISKDDMSISSIPLRSELYIAQTPQTFKLLEFMEISNKLSDEEKEILTDACKIYVLKNRNVGLVEGELFNIKITTKYDLKLANLLLANQDLMLEK